MAGHVTSRDYSNAHKTLFEKPKGRIYLRNLTADERIILKLTLNEMEVYGVNYSTK
jgi:hypothetical protein